MEQIRQIKLEDFNEVFGERVESKALLTRLLEVTEGVLPFQPDRPTLPMSPYLAYPGEGLSLVANIASQLGIQTMLETYEQDIFTNSNPEKSDLIRPRFLLPKVQMARPKITIEVQRIIADVQTVYVGVNLSEFYRRLSSLLLPDMGVVDMSEFYLAQTRIRKPSATKPEASSYYFGLMAFNQVFGTGLNTGGNEDSRFYQEVVLPNILSAAKVLGVEPVSVKPPVGMPTGRAARVINISNRFENVENLEETLDLTRKE